MKKKNAVYGNLMGCFDVFISERILGVIDKITKCFRWLQREIIMSIWMATDGN